MAAGASPDDDDKRLETVRLEALQAAAGSPDAGHRLIARRLFRSGQADKALSELIRFSRERPMTPRMATALSTLALATGRTGPILTLLTQGVEETEGRERVGVMRALARLQRRTGQVEPAIETLSVLLAEAAEDRRSRLVLNALLEQRQQWEALDASLDKETRLLLRRRYFRAASRTALRRARLWGERLDDAPRAALRYGQAAQYAEQGQDPHSVFLLRMLWLRALVDADAPSRTREEATRVTLEAAGRVGREARARAFVRELGLPLPVGPSADEPADVTVSGEPPAPSPPSNASTTLADFEAAAAEPVPRGAVGEALLAATGRSSAASVEALSRLEARYVAQGAWTELARFYRQTADGRPPPERASWLEKLAELLESELEDPVGAATVWAEVAQLTGDAEAVSEQVRILDERNDVAAVKQALDAGVGRAQSPSEKARLLVLRAQEARQRGEEDAARADFEAALKVAPTTLEAAAGLAELSVARGDPGPLKTFERLLVSASRQLPERPAMFRRLARLGDVMREARLASAAWGEVLALSPGDEEALERSFTLARALKDDARTETVTRAILTKDPRGVQARAAWLELVAVLERAGRPDEAVGALRDAVKAEPGHLEAWLALVDRLVARKLDEEAAWAMEHAATAAPEGPARIAVWKRLARHARERLGDDEKAEKYEERLERFRPPEAASGAPGLPGGPLVVPPRTSRPKLEPVRVPVRSPKDEAESEAFAQALGAEREPEDTREMPVVIPSRLRHVLEPILKDVETREAPADDFIDDDDIDEVMEVRSEEVVVPGDSGPQAPQSPRPQVPAQASQSPRGPQSSPVSQPQGAQSAQAPPSQRPPVLAPSPRAPQAPVSSQSQSPQGPRVPQSPAPPPGAPQASRLPPSQASPSAVLRVSPVSPSLMPSQSSPRAPQSPPVSPAVAQSQSSPRTPQAPPASLSPQPSRAQPSTHAAQEDPDTTPVPPPAKLKPQGTRDEATRASLPTRPAPVWREGAEAGTPGAGRRAVSMDAASDDAPDEPGPSPRPSAEAEPGLAAPTPPRATTSTPDRRGDPSGSPAAPRAGAPARGPSRDAGAGEVSPLEGVGPLILPSRPVRGSPREGPADGAVSESVRPGRSSHGAEKAPGAVAENVARPIEPPLAQGGTRSAARVEAAMSPDRASRRPEPADSVAGLTGRAPSPDLPTGKVAAWSGGADDAEARSSRSSGDDGRDDPSRDEAWERDEDSRSARTQERSLAAASTRGPRLRDELTDEAARPTNRSAEPLDDDDAGSPRDESSDDGPAQVTGRASAWSEGGDESAEVSEVTAPPPDVDEARRTAEIPAPALGDPLASIPPSFGPSPSKLLSEERQALFERVRANPLEAEGYRMLAEHFDTANDASRSSLMLELARALEGDPNAAPRTPKLILSATDRAGLRHPMVRTEAAELVALATPAVCRLFPAKGKDAASTEEFSLERGKGAKAAADALLAAVRLLGMRAPDVFVSDDGGPPFTALHATAPRLVVSRLAVKKPLPDAELRFYAGRALFTLSPELLALRTLKRDQLRAGLEAVGNALKGHATTEARLVRDALTPRSIEKLKALWPKVAKSLDLGALMEGARHSVNRAGLVVCGGISPAIESLRVKRALPVEVTELVRFAASERYLQLRNRRLGKKAP
ncbi:MAG: tetratricopeptide repeat protein [Myxococcaceae bacterium]|nr:tetratricopeptide repeat protein [Myxococcaceae bacterium]